MSEPAAEIVEGRKGDGFIVVTQDNAGRQLVIREVNAMALSQLGYGADELVGRKLEVMLGVRTALVIDDDLEYDDEAPDMADVLIRQRELVLRQKNGKELVIPCTINRVMAEDHFPRFQLIIPNDRENRARQQWRDFLKLNLEGRQEIDATTGMPTRATAEAYLALLANYAAENDVQCAFATLRLDRFDKSLARYGAESCVQLLQHVANCCRATFRAEDMTCLIAQDTLGLLLVDISRESVRVVLNRLRWNIRTHTIDFGGKSDFSTTISILFDMLTPQTSDTLLASCADAIAQLDKDTRNSLIERGNAA